MPPAIGTNRKGQSADTPQQFCARHPRHRRLSRSRVEPHPIAIRARLTNAANSSKTLVCPSEKEPELDPKEQYKRFKEAAKDAGVTGQAAQYK